MRSTFLVLALVALPAAAQSEDCQAIRRAMALARSANVDSGDLFRLERHHCEAAAAPTGGGSTCQQLDAFWMLAVAVGESSDVARTLEAQRGVWCSRGEEPTRPLQWANGTTLRTSSGALYWPNAAMARSSSGAWYVASGTMVRSSVGSLSYPSGATLRTSSGRTSLPSGEQADEGRIAALACDADLSWCRYFLGEVQRSSGLHRDFALLGLGLLTGQR